jgi:hypothetical protein
MRWGTFLQTVYLTVCERKHSLMIYESKMFVNGRAFTRCPKGQLNNTNVSDATMAPSRGRMALMVGRRTELVGTSSSSSTALAQLLQLAFAGRNKIISPTDPKAPRPWVNETFVQVVASFQFRRVNDKKLPYYRRSCLKTIIFRHGNI